MPIISERTALLGARQASPRKFGQNTVSRMLSVYPATAGQMAPGVQSTPGCFHFPQAQRLEVCPELLQ